MARVEPYINHPNPSLRLPSGQMCPVANVPASSASICRNIALYSTIQDWVEEVGYVSEGEHSISDAPSHATAPAPVPEAAVSDATGRAPASAPALAPASAPASTLGPSTIAGPAAEKKQPPGPPPLPSTQGTNLIFVWILFALLFSAPSRNSPSTARMSGRHPGCRATVSPTLVVTELLRGGGGRHRHCHCHCQRRHRVSGTHD